MMMLKRPQPMTTDSLRPKPAKNTNVPRGSGLTENDEVRRGSYTPFLRHSCMLRILVKAILLGMPHIDLPSAQSPPIAMVRPARSQPISGLPPNKVSLLLSNARVLLDKSPVKLFSGVCTGRVIVRK